METSAAQKKPVKFYVNYDYDVMTDGNLGPWARILYAYLKFRQGANGLSWPKSNTIARDLGTTRPTILKARKELVAAKLLIVLQGRGGKNRQNRYKVLSPNRTENRPAPTPQVEPKKPVERVKNLTAGRVKNLYAYNKEEKLPRENKQPKSVVVSANPEKTKAAGRLLQRISATRGKGWTPDQIQPYAQRWAASWPLATISATASKWAQAATSPGLIEFYLKRTPTIDQERQKRERIEAKRDADAARRAVDRTQTVVSRQGAEAHRAKIQTIRESINL